jgi:carotenoid cleavage dioxygenase
MPAGNLCGTLYRNGPNPQFAPRGPYHWFGGDGMIHAFHIENGNVSYKNRWVRTPKWEIENEGGRGPLRHVRQSALHGSAVIALNSTIANTNIVWHGGKLLALEEAHAPFSLDPASLMPVGQGRRLRDLRRQADRAVHRPSQVRPRRPARWCSSATRRRAASAKEVSIQTVTADGRVTRGRDPRRAVRQSMIHDFAVTKNWIVLPVSSRSPRRWSARWSGCRPSPGSRTRARTSPSSRATARVGRT